MRTKVSDTKRKAIISISVLMTIGIIIGLIWKLVPYTKFLHEDISKAKVICTDVQIISDGDLPAVIDGISWSDGYIDREAIYSQVASDGELCLVELEYTFFSNIEENLSDFIMEIRENDNATGRIYAYSDMMHLYNSDDEYAMRQFIVADKSDIIDVYFSEGMLPRNFKAPYLYELFYNVQSDGGRRAVGFTTAVRK